MADWNRGRDREESDRQRNRWGGGDWYAERRDWNRGGSMDDDRSPAYRGARWDERRDEFEDYGRAYDRGFDAGFERDDDYERRRDPERDRYRR